MKTLRVRTYEELKKRLCSIRGIKHIKQVRNREDGWLLVQVEECSVSCG